MISNLNIFCFSPISLLLNSNKLIIQIRLYSKRPFIFLFEAKKLKVYLLFLSLNISSSCSPPLFLSLLSYPTFFCFSYSKFQILRFWTKQHNFSYFFLFCTFLSNCFSLYLILILLLSISVPFLISLPDWLILFYHIPF